MSARPGDPPIEPRLLAEAADWLVRLSDAQRDAAQREAERRDFERWLARSDAHGQAWQRAERLRGMLSQLPPELGARAIRSMRTSGSRRGWLKGAAVVALGAPLGWALTGQPGWRSWRAAYRTAPGEQRVVDLADGSRLTLNTATALDVDVGPAAAGVRLYDGEVLVERAGSRRAGTVEVRTDTGLVSLAGDGGRFSVRCLPTVTRVAVFDGRVQILPRRGLADTLPAGQSCDFDAEAIVARRPVSAIAAAWSQGMLIVPDWPLGDLVAELGRYRRGLLDCDARIAGWRVSGAYPVGDVDRCLKMLVDTLPVRLAGVPPIWVRVEAAAATRA